jgi:hypothetical protein
MYLHNTDERQFLYYVCFKPIGGLHGLKLTFGIETSLLPILYMKIVLQWKIIRTPFLVHFTIL